jgi:hypothetical protein
MTDASYIVTFYELFLGDQDSVTGHYRMGYTITSGAVVIFSNNGTFSYGVLGKHVTSNFIGFTKYSVEQGDVIYDSFGRHYEIKRVDPMCNGDQFKYNLLSLEELTNFPFLSGFFGFEDTEHGTIGCGFEEGFEHGTWAI